MIGLCEEGKSSPDALGRSAGVNSFGFFAAHLGLSPCGSFVEEEPDFHLLAQLYQPTRRLSLCSPASLETNPWEYPELALLHPVALPARPGRRRAEEFLSSPLPAMQRSSRWSPRSGSVAAHGPPPSDRPPAFEPPRA